jgi:hypothetical protein
MTQNHGLSKNLCNPTIQGKRYYPLSRSRWAVREPPLPIREKNQLFRMESVNYNVNSKYE